jgi:hypothetical protein
MMSVCWNLLLKQINVGFHARTLGCGGLKKREEKE